MINAPARIHDMPQLTRPEFDANLIARYGGEGPRYTSYPTADRFSEKFTETDFRAAIADSNRLPIPADLSIYVHVPFCRSPCFYCGCNRVITRSPTAGAEFLDDLQQELALLAPAFDTDRIVRQVHLGGGTPTFLSAAQIGHLMKQLGDHFPLSRDGEFGLEVDPRTVDPAAIRELKQVGFNRISIGVQDLDPAVQAAVNRVHDEATVAALIGAARGAGFDSVSMDLIYGLPLQTPESFARTVEAVVRMRPDRISLFNYAHMPHLFKAQRRIDPDDLPSAVDRLDIFHDTLTRFLDAGYEFIGLDHFALPDDPLARARADGSLVRNFQGYSTGGDLDLIGFGPSAISRIGDSFAQNHRGLDPWKQVIAEGRFPVARGLTRTTDDRLRADVISRIMCQGMVDFSEFEKFYELSFRAYFADELDRLQPMAEDGLIEWTDEGFQVTPTGLLFLRAIARVFDAWLAPAGNQHKRFSRIV